MGSFPGGASPYGVMDMAGNVAEWVSDWYDEDYYSTYDPDSLPANPTGPILIPSTPWMVVRGGGFSNPWDRVRTAERSRGYPDDKNLGLGFRCAKSP